MSKTKIEQPQSVSGAFDELLNKMYISNVQNRLRQLNEPTENDCKRWVWELIQNAKDSISQDKNKNSVDLRLVVRDKDVRFSHNGSPFTAKAQLGLLYKYSEGKVNNSESTGRFGTGFLTTHTLSKIVSIEGDVYTDDNYSSLCGFSATMYRDGIDEPELLEGVIKMKDSIIYTKELNNWTTYTYHLRTHQNEKALQLGLENFISNITQTMLFCKELNSVELDNNGIVTRIIRKETQTFANEIFLTEFDINGETSYSRKFIHKILKNHNEDLSKRFKTDRFIRLTAAIEIDSYNNIIENKEAPSLFCVLPLVGSEKHIMPIYLNSPDFEPDSERESLILIGDDILAEKNVISEGGINRLILKESVKLYDSLVSFFSQGEYHNLHLLAKGLKAVPKFEKNFNKDWFEEEIIKPYREVLKKYAIVETKVGNQKLFTEDDEPNIIIPKDSNLENQDKIFNLSAEIFSDKLPLASIAKDWAELAWKECGLFRLKDLCRYVADKGSIKNLQVSTNEFDWLNSLLSFIKETDESLFKEFALVPNRNGDYVSLRNENFAEGVGLTNYMLEVLNDLGDDLTPVLLNSNITSINLPLKIDAKSIAEKINDQADKIITDKDLSVTDKVKGLLPLLNTTPTDESLYTLEFINKQKQINYFTKIVYADLNIYENINNEIPEKAWQSCHKWLITQLLKTVAEYKKIETLPAAIENQIEWLNNFIAFVSKEIKEGDLDEYAIIPNQKGDFCYKKELSKDINIPEEIKTERAEKFGIKLKDTLLHQDIDSINITTEKSITTVVQLINNIFIKNVFEEGDSSLSFSIFLIHFLPEETSQLLYNSQKSLLDIVRKYYYSRSQPYSKITISCNVEDFWSKANIKITSFLQGHLEKDASVENLKAFLSESGKTYDHGDTIIFLNDFYDYLKKTNNIISKKIIPNQNGIFCSLDGELYRDDNIPNQLKNILYLLNPKEDFRNILSETSLSIKPSHSKTIADIAKVIDDSIKDTYSNSRNWDNDNFKEAIRLLMIEWFPKNKGKESRDIFHYTYERKETIEMNILWSLEERQRMQRARSIAPELLDKFIATSEGINTLNKEKEALEAKIAELKTKVERPIFRNSIQEIANEFPDITADKIRELLKLEGGNKQVTDPQIPITTSNFSELLSSRNLTESNLLQIINWFDFLDNDEYKEGYSTSNHLDSTAKNEENSVARQKVFERLTGEGYEFTQGMGNHSVVNGVFKDGVEYPMVIKSYRNNSYKLNITPGEWIQLSKVNSMLWIYRGNNNLYSIELKHLLRENSEFHVHFETSRFDFEGIVKFAQVFRLMKNVRFQLDSPEFTIADSIDYTFNKVNRIQNDLSKDDPKRL